MRADYAKKSPQQPHRKKPSYVFALMIGLGIICALILASIAFIATHHHHPLPPTTVLPPKSKTAPPKTTKKVTASSQSLQFDFYTLLPKMHVVVPQNSSTSNRSINKIRENNEYSQRIA